MKISVPKEVHPAERKPTNLALQGGGTHGAFTWGVLDKLLEDGRLDLDGVSGTSAGAINAVALAAGLMEGGREGARAKLEEIWRGVSDFARYHPLLSHPLATKDGDDSVASMALCVLTGVLSPYDLNPLDFNPLRDILDQSINFRQLRRKSPLQLYIAATDVATGRARIFETSEVSLDVVLASACLPSLYKAVKIRHQHFWDGGFSANPAILPLIRGGGAEDTLLVQINPTHVPGPPTKAQDILAQVNRITFNQPLLREIEIIKHSRWMARRSLVFGSRYGRRIKRHRFHLIEATRYTKDLGHVSKLTPDWELLSYLRDSGRTVADSWLRRNWTAIGRRSTVDLEAKVL
ncbi:MAG: hypothetical protein CMM60_13360 [Rhodospirillaceae bacterium]|nr:hypothetical protein [Rhodospirillaceae bacterium]HAL47951.1 hypothetical protein [Dehalococcoidia bacterium]